MRLAYAFVPVPIAAAAGIAVSVACGDAAQTVDGGDALFDAASPPFPCIPYDGDIPDVADASWGALYQDYFGPTGLGQCGDSTRTGVNGTASCHHDPGGSGAQASGFICGDTQQSCYDGITSPKAAFVGERVVGCGPDDSYVLQVLRQDSGGIMPYYPENVYFSADDMLRIRAWIIAGAPNN